MTDDMQLPPKAKKNPTRNHTITQQDHFNILSVLLILTPLGNKVMQELENEPVSLDPSVLCAFVNVVFKTYFSNQMMFSHKVQTVQYCNNMSLNFVKQAPNFVVNFSVFII